MKHLTSSNVLTVSRLICAPLILPWMITYVIGDACLMFSLLASTDYFDGLCARLWRQETSIGAWLDPLADKVLLASVMIPLVSIHSIHWSIALICIVREFVVLAVRHIAALASVSITVSRWGKCKTMMQCMFVVICLTPALREIAWLYSIVATGVIGITIGSMLEYLYRLTQIRE